VRLDFLWSIIYSFIYQYTGLIGRVRHNSSEISELRLSTEQFTFLVSVSEKVGSVYAV